MAKRSKKPVIPAGMKRMVLVDAQQKQLRPGQGLFACDENNIPPFVRIPAQNTSDAGMDTKWRTFTRYDDYPGVLTPDIERPRPDSIMYYEDPF